MRSAQIAPFGRRGGSPVEGWLAARNGGSARGYQELSTPLAIPVTAKQADGQAVCLYIASAGVNPPTSSRRECYSSIADPLVVRSQ